MAQMSVLLLSLLWLGAVVAGDGTYSMDDTPGLGRVFDGIGGLSGGGATSRLLVSYPQEQRDQILDYLFKPYFAASLQILKVEIGGDAQSTDGTEASHMHTKTDEDYTRGYEWWLMKEAKKRNPDIKLYALSWTFPAWVGNGSGSPYQYPEITANYIIKFITGAQNVHNLTIDYVGIWNERGYDITYIKTLRKVLDSNSLTHVQIVAADTDFGKISTDCLSDADLSKAVSILGAHYPGTVSNANAMTTGKPLWASEDFSTYNDNIGAGCWARILNQNYVNGHMTSTISWNLVASYYAGLPFFRDGLMTAIEPWSGHYVDEGPIWISDEDILIIPPAHTTQFTQPGVHYLAHGSGVGKLQSGGSYVTFFEPKTNDFTIVIETMSRNNSVCIRPFLPQYDVATQTAIFQLKGNLSKATKLNQWMSSVNDGTYFKQSSPVMVTNNQFSITLPVDTVLTLSTLTMATRSGYPNIPESKTFPVPYKDSFQDYDPASEARYFADQTGVFEISEPKDEELLGNKVMRQVVTSRPITWCKDANQTISIIGNQSWVSMSAHVQVKLEAMGSSVFLAAGVNKGGCAIATASKGIYAFINANGSYSITSDLAMMNVIKYGAMRVKTSTWYKISVMIKKGSSMADIELGDVKVTVNLPSGYAGGYIGFGTGGFYPAQFDDFGITEASS